LSAINIPGLDIDERCGSHRVRVRVHPFHALTATKSSDLDAIQWGCLQLSRLHKLHAQLKAEDRLPKSQLTKESAQKLGLLGLIEASSEDLPAFMANSPGAALRVSDVMQCYRNNEGKQLGADFRSRATRIEGYFGHMTLAEVTTKVLDEYEGKRLRGMLGGGRSAGAAYATRNREHQQNKRRKARGIPLVESKRAGRGLPDSGSVKHELSTFRRVLKAHALRDDATREMLTKYIQYHPVMTRPLPAATKPRKKRYTTEEIKSVLGHMRCPKKRAAILLALYTTLRRGEVCSLRCEDVSFEQGTVRLRPPMIEDPHHPGEFIPKPKSKTKDREVPLIPEAREILMRLAPSGTTGQIFNFAASSLTQAWGRAAERAGVKDGRVHDLRREGLSWLFDEHKLTLEQLTIFSGHENVKTLEEHYFQPNAARMAASIAVNGKRRDIEV
jgi:integrase